MRTIAFWTLLIIGGVLRFYSIDSKTMWLDEAFSVWVANNTLSELFGWLVQIDQHPPLYYTLLHFWQQAFGDLQGEVRAFSALCSTLAMPLVYLAARRLLNPNIALVTLFILALSPFHVRFAQETRMYGLLTLTVALALFAISHLWSDQPGETRSRRWLYLLIPAQLAVMLTHNTATVYFTVSLNIAILGLALWHRLRGDMARRANLYPFNLVEGEADDTAEFDESYNKDEPKAQAYSLIPQGNFVPGWVLLQSVIVALWAMLWGGPFVKQVVGVDREFWIPPLTLQWVWNNIHNLQLQSLPGWLEYKPYWHFYYWDIVYFILAFCGIIWLIRRRPSRAWLLSILYFVPLIISVLVSLRRPIFYDRTLIWVTLPYFMLLATGVVWLGNSLKSMGRWASVSAVSLLLALILFLSGLSLSSHYFYSPKEDWAKASDYVASNIQSDEMILFNASWVQIPFEYYLRHYDVEPELRGLPVDLFDAGILEPKMQEDVIPYMRELLADESSVWLVYSHDWYTDPEQIIPGELSNQMTLKDDQSFVGLRVMRFEK
ncbi:MAG: glycosyltransferase family 39 protein [Chloroflexota bacterium]